MSTNDNTSQQPTANSQQNLVAELIDLLSSDDRLVSEGKLVKNKVIELALNIDPLLIKYLLKSANLKRHFFSEVESVLVFDKIKFQRFVNNKQFLPDSYTSFKNKIGLTSNNEFISSSKEVVLAWPYKDCILEGGQDKEDAKRDEIFWNETLAPDQIDRMLSQKALTNFKKFDKNGEVGVSTISKTDNLIIKGNNLLALHTLKSKYAGRVKLIYIDPPYNTANDSFRYNDSFDHSTWLTYIKNRLLIARELLAQNGVIFIHLDFNEVHYCKVLMDEIFGRDQFVNEIIWRRKQATSYGNSKFGITNDTILFYSKTSDYDFYPIYSLDDDHTQEYIKERFVHDDGDGRKYMKSPLVNSLYRPNLKYEFQGINPPKNGWLYSKEKMQSFFDNGELIIPEDANARIYRRIFLDTYKGQVIQNIWTDIPIVNPMAKEQTDFSTQKPEKLLERIIQSTTQPQDIVLDFQLGSGTTAAVAHKMGRQYIGVEQMDYIESVAVERLKKVISGDQAGISKSVNWQGGGSFVYCELAKANQSFIDSIQEASQSDELLAIWNNLQSKAFLSYRVNPKAFDESKSDFAELSFDDQKRFLIEVLDKNLLYVPISEIDDETYAISDADKQLNYQFFGLESA